MLFPRLLRRMYFLQAALLHRRYDQHSQPEDTALRPLDKVCSDLSGPFPVESASRGPGKLYFALLIDTATNYTWIYFLQHKTVSPKVLEMWLQCIQTQTGKVPELLSTDESFMNAYPERMNSTILKAARSMSCQFAQNPGVIHWRAVKRILRT